MYNKKLGKFGETLAIKYYKKLGYKLLIKNFYSRYGEIDLVLEKNKQIILVEVKTRSSKKYLWAEESINQQKINNIYKTYQILQTKMSLSPNFELEALIIELDNKRAKIYRYTL